MNNLYRVTIRHKYAAGDHADYTIKVEADSEEVATEQCSGPNRYILSVTPVFRLNHIQIVALIALGVLLAFTGIFIFIAIN